MTLSDDEAAETYRVLRGEEEQEEAQEVLEQAQEEWNQEFRLVEKDARNAGRVRSSASDSTSVLAAVEVDWEPSSEEEEEEQEEEEEEKDRGEGEGNQGREQDGAEEETKEESRDKEENGAGGKLVEYTIDEMKKSHAAPVTKLTVDLLSRILLLSFPLQSVCSIFLEEMFLRR